MLKNTTKLAAALAATLTLNTANADTFYTTFVEAEAHSLSVAKQDVAKAFGGGLFRTAPSGYKVLGKDTDIFSRTGASANAATLDIGGAFTKDNNMAGIYGGVRIADEFTARLGIMFSTKISKGCALIFSHDTSVTGPSSSATKLSFGFKL